MMMRHSFVLSINTMQFRSDGEISDITLLLDKGERYMNEGLVVTMYDELMLPGIIWEQSGFL